MSDTTREERLKRAAEEMFVHILGTREFLRAVTNHADLPEESRKVFSGVIASVNDLIRRIDGEERSEA